MKRGILILAVFVLCFSIVSADVAYVYRNERKVDENVIGVFNELGLEVEMVDERNLPANFDAYKLIFVGDERLRNKEMLPVNDFPSVIMSRRYGDVWGLTDNEGISKMGSSGIMNVLVNGDVIPVYTKAFRRGPLGIPYYYLHQNNKAPSLMQVAGTRTTSSGYKFGDVISYAEPGAALFGGRTQNENLCFYGIIESKYWTSEAREMFKDCVEFVAGGAEEPMMCYDDLDCPEPETSETFCMDGDVYQTVTSYTCGEGDCIPGEEDVLVTHCEFGCDAESGTCEYESPGEGVHDVSLVEFTNSVGGIKLMKEGEVILGDEIECNMDYKVYITVENNGDFIEDVTFGGSVGPVLFNHNPISGFEPGDSSTKYKTVNMELGAGEYDIRVEAFIEGFTDGNPADNVATRRVSVVCES